MAFYCYGCPSPFAVNAANKGNIQSKKSSTRMMYWTCVGMTIALIVFLLFLSIKNVGNKDKTIISKNMLVLS